jgi:hypothetical protein
MDNVVVLSCGSKVSIEDAVMITYGWRKGEYILTEDSVYTEDGEMVHQDDSYFCESDDCYYSSSEDLCHVSSGNHNGWFHSDDVVYVQDEGEYYHINDEGDYFWLHSDGDYYNHEERTQSRHRYHSQERERIVNDNTKFTIGFEVEKEDEDVLTSWDLDDVDATKWCREEDGSLDDDSGFELVSPTYDLMADDLDKALTKDILKEHINASYSSSCGGHINFGIVGMSGEEVYNQVKGFVPVILSLYQGRLTNSYCYPRKSYHNSKSSAVSIKYGYMEFRVFSAVRSVDNLLWRRDLLRYMASNLNKGTLFFIREMLTPTSKLHKHLLKHIDASTITRRAAFAAAMAEAINGNDLSKWITFEGFANIVEGQKPRANDMLN